MTDESAPIQDHFPTPTPDDPQPEKPRQNAPMTPPESALNAASAKQMLEDAKKTLEYHIAGREVTVRVREKLLTFKRWGLRKKTSLGSRVLSLIGAISAIVPPEALIEGTVPVETILSILQHVSDQVMEILAASMSSPFGSPAEAEDWLDDTCDFQDLFNMCAVVFDQNFGGTEGLGKARKDVEGLAKSLQSLLKK